MLHLLQEMAAVSQGKVKRTTRSMGKSSQIFGKKAWQTSLRTEFPKLNAVGMAFTKGLLQKLRALNDLPRFNKRDAKGLRQSIGIRKAKHLVGTFPVETFVQHSVDVGENQVHRFLREVVEGSSAGNDVPEKRVIVFNVRLLIRRIRVAEEHGICKFVVYCRAGNTDDD